jgi:hypothetical protein
MGKIEQKTGLLGIPLNRLSLFPNKRKGAPLIGSAFSKESKEKPYIMP